MQVMVLEQDQKRQAQLAQALMEKGFHVLCVESLDAAECFVRMDIVDVLVLGERVGGRLSHSLALLAECRNPMVSAVLLTERSGPDMDELFDLIPAVYAILGRDVAPRIVTQIVMSAISALVEETPRARSARRWQAAEAAEPVIEDAAFKDMLEPVAAALPETIGYPADFGSAWAESLAEVTMAGAEPASEAYRDHDRDHLRGAGDRAVPHSVQELPEMHSEPPVDDADHANTRWYRPARARLPGQNGSHVWSADFAGPVVAPRDTLPAGLPVFTPITLMQADAPRRRLHLG